MSQNGAQKKVKIFFVGGRRFFSGKFGRIRAKILRIPQNLPAPCCTTTDLWIFWYYSKEFWSCICESPVPNVHRWKICSARCEWALVAGWTNSLLCWSVARRSLVSDKCWVKMDKFVVKLKRHSSSYETDQGQQPRKVFIDRCQNSRPIQKSPSNASHTSSFNSNCWTKFQHTETREDLSANNHGTASLAWLLCQCIYKPPRQFLKTLLRVKGVDQTLVLN